VWQDPAVHARDFSAQYAQDLALVVAERIQQLGLADRQNGCPDPDAVPLARFLSAPSRWRQRGRKCDQGLLYFF